MDPFAISKSDWKIGGPSKAVGEKTQRIPEVDGLRGIAILLILFFHYINNQLTGSAFRAGKLLYGATSFFWSGVDLFFVLSGFLIGTILLRNKRSDHYFSTFYMRRLVRIIPNYYLLITLFALLAALPYFSECHFFSTPNPIPLWSYFLMVHNIYMGMLNTTGNAGLDVTWSIGIEEQFYLIFPLIVYFLPKKWIPAFLVIAIAAASLIRLQFHQWIPRYVLLPCRMDSIAAGALIAWLNEEHSLAELVRKRKAWFIVIMVVDVALCSYMFARYHDLGVNRHFFIAVFFSGCLVLALTVQNSFYGAFLRNRWLVWIGTISYSLYLFHTLILGLMEYIFLHNTRDPSINNGKDLLVSLIALGISILFSWLIYKKLETPFVQLGKRFKY
jgi:peptidoglycan/LPS O-acetylase OafA/YrhL